MTSKFPDLNKELKCYFERFLGKVMDSVNSPMFYGITSANFDNFDKLLGRFCQPFDESGELSKDIVYYLKLFWESIKEEKESPPCRGKTTVMIAGNLDEFRDIIFIISRILYCTMNLNQPDQAQAKRHHCLNKGKWNLLCMFPGEYIRAFELCYPIQIQYEGVMYDLRYGCFRNSASMKIFHKDFGEYHIECSMEAKKEDMKYRVVHNDDAVHGCDDCATFQQALASIKSKKNEQENTMMAESS